MLQYVKPFSFVPERFRQTDGRTDEQNCYINIARQRLIDHIRLSIDQPIRPL